MAARVPTGQAPKIDGQLNDPAWDLASAGGRLLPARAAAPGAPSTERTEFRDPLRRPEDLLRRLGLRLRPGGHHRQRAEARLRPHQGRSHHHRHRHVPRPAQRVLLRDQPARRPQGRAVHRQRPHHATTTGTRCGSAGPASDDQRLVRRDRDPAQPAAVQDEPGRDHVGPERLPRSSSGRTKRRTGSRSRASRAPRLRRTCRTPACSRACTT